MTAGIPISKIGKKAGPAGSPLLAIAVSLALLSPLFSTQPAMGALSSADTAGLESLENKYFDHTYPKDTDEARIERLEELIFGEAKTGDDNTRLSSLLAAVPSLQSSGPPSSSPSPAAGQSSPSGNNGNDNTDADPDDTSTDYPRVDAIEQVMLGKVYKGESLKRRLDQLEIKAFGKSPNIPDLSDRVDNLERYVDSHYHKSISQITDPRKIYNYSSPEESPSTYRAPAYSGSGSYGMAPPMASGMPGSMPPVAPPGPTTPIPDQVSWLENQVFGRSNPQMPLVERLQKLDQAVFPSEPPDSSASIPMQVKVLINAVELMHQPGGAQQTAGEGQFPSWPPASQSEYPASQAGYASTNNSFGNNQYQQQQQQLQQ
ncbi:MAG: hypothetical protein KC777_27305, partial [Cyanobacteria bacterium HKST-UBA02]|nr:hypothetical protein [Cyanobacteria bacterium HKST-UBA02]